MTKKIKRLLIANRGEIAVRVIRAAQELDIETVSIYSDPDAGTLQTRLADFKLGLGGIAAGETYLNQEKIIAAAIQSGADAIHPGYGFLSENAIFAERVAEEGFTYVAPRLEAIRLMGNKDQARLAVSKRGVPVVPGGKVGNSLDEAKKLAKKIGYPVMIKAVAGGSGRGMRVVKEESELENKLGEARREAQAAFANAEVILEKFIQQPRHIEVQVFGDSHGNILHFGERECSLQRRNQKLVEECPAANLNPKLREKILAAALEAAKAVSYVNAGTVEFIVQDGTEENSLFYFLEMNTRIQVEHPVTEQAFGIDLVKLQLEIAQGKKLPVKQKDLKTRGHAIEFRVYAENPAKAFSPTSGKIIYLARAGGLGFREETWVEPGTVVSTYYDALLAKLIVTGNTRSEAIDRANRVLDEYVIEGLETTLSFHRWLVQQKDFIDGKVDVQWIERMYKGERVLSHKVGPLSLPPSYQELIGVN